jgi:hypothetical protein
MSFKSVTLALEFDDFGMIADVWNGLLYIQESVQDIHHPVLRSGWTNAQAILCRWQQRCPQLPSDAQKAFVITNLVHIFGDREAIDGLAIPLYEFADLFRPSNIERIPRLLKNDDHWGRVLDCARVVHETVRV